MNKLSSGVIKTAINVHKELADKFQRSCAERRYKETGKLKGMRINHQAGSAERRDADQHVKRFDK